MSQTTAVTTHLSQLTTFLCSSLMLMPLIACDDEDKSLVMAGTSVPSGGGGGAATAAGVMSPAPIGGQGGDISPEAGVNAGGGAGAEPVGGQGLAAGIPSMGGSPLAGGEMSPEAPTTPVTACEDFGASSCFANSDCNPDARCANVGTAPDFIPCCIRGARGEAGAGTPCTDENGEQLCASSLCIEGYCSAECNVEADCPDVLPSCIPIAFSGSDKMWCSPRQ